MADYQALIEARGLDGHGIYCYLPNLHKRFVTSDINALIAPRAHLALAGDCDPHTLPAGLARIDDNMRRVHTECRVPEEWQLLRSATCRFETADMLQRVLVSGCRGRK